MAIDSEIIDAFANAVVINSSSTNKNGVIHKIKPPIETKQKKFYGLFKGNTFSFESIPICKKDRASMEKDGDSLTSNNSKVNCEKCLKELDKS